jgi:hypothetical protein
MFDPQKYLSFGNIGYNLRDNEIILIQSLLTQEYFEGLIPAIKNKYVKHISYDEVLPMKTQMYENTFTSIQDLKKSDDVCEKNIEKKIVSSIWNSCFPENFYEIVYGKQVVCTFEFIIDLIERRTGEKFSTNQIKNKLYEEYNKYFLQYIHKIVDILILEGKKTLGDQVNPESQMSFFNLIYSDNYFLTTLDLWLLVTKFQIPTIFISQKTILQTNYEKNEFLGYGTRDDDFAFIVLPGFRPENIPSYKLILSDKNDSFISLDRLNDACVERIYNAIEEPVTIEEYLTDFIKPSKTKYVKKKQNIIIIEEDEDEQEEHVPEEEKVLEAVVEKERKRCKNGERRNKLGECVKKETVKVTEPILIESEEEEPVVEPVVEEEERKVRNRCKNGERRINGECVKKDTIKKKEKKNKTKKNKI